MIITFIGREYEVEKLLDFINNDLDNAALIYGRRRVGKSELINRCIKENR